MPIVREFRKELCLYLFFLFFLGLSFPETAHAGYLDPGSGSILVQGIISVMAFFGRIADKIRGIFGMKRN